MRQQDFFTVNESGLPFEPDEAFNTELVQRIYRDSIPEFTDIEVAEASLVLIRNELIECGTTERHKLSDNEFRAMVRAAMAVSRRLGLTFPEIPFRDHSSYRAYWRAEGMVGAGSWEARRQYIRQLFQPYDEQITAYIHRLPDTSLVTPVPTPPNPTWQAIEDEITHLRHRYAEARSAQDLCSVGLACVRITEILGDLVFDPTTHLPPGETDPGRGSTINRFTFVIDHELQGPDNANMRRLVRGVIPFIQGVKHSGNPSKKDAAMAADATIALVNMMRNITDPAL